MRGVDRARAGVAQVPKQVRPVLREELLYDNVFVTQWQQKGLLRRVPASLGEAADAPAPAPRAARKAASKAASAAPKKTPSAKTKSKTKGNEGAEA